ncbi:unnamed protein product [Spirodela intermedia]|uniref:Uncharacterized protein n=1 Tax=Spirodela intermedia TaxID=51605 RepID=A0A7I8KW99_SPIIN|nr:unnamed protein product [Spirodela intermedia]
MSSGAGVQRTMLSFQTPGRRGTVAGEKGITTRVITNAGTPKRSEDKLRALCGKRISSRLLLILLMWTVVLRILDMPRILVEIPLIGPAAQKP